MDDIRVRVGSQEPIRRPHTFLIRDRWIPLPIRTVGKLLHYSSICGSCNIAGATVSPSEFVPVCWWFARFSLAIDVKVDVKVSFAGSAWPRKRTGVLPWLCLFLNRADLPSCLGFVTGHLQLLTLEPRWCHVLSL